MEGINSEFIKKEKENGKIISSEEALSDVEPFLTEEEVAKIRKEKYKITKVENCTISNEEKKILDDFSAEYEKEFDENNIEETPEITAEEMSLKFNKIILKNNKLPKKFSAMDEDSEFPDVFTFDKNLKLYNRYKTEENDVGNNGELIKKRIENKIICRYDGKELMDLIKDGKIFVMMIFDENKVRMRNG